MKLGKILSSERPDLLKEWDYEKNASICSPNEISVFSKKKVWWVCKTCGHHWQAEVGNRANNNSGCPNCSGRIVHDGINDLQSKYPLLCREWDYEKNDIKPSEVSAGSNKKVWWKCSKCGFEWQSSIVHRVSGRGCPYCAGKTVWKGHNDLETLSPQIAEEWNYEKNTDSPSDYQNGSSKKVWWKCSKCGYEWEMHINSRTTDGQGCPFCAHRAVWIGHNDLKTTNPELCKEWDYEKNIGLTPESFSAGSHKKVWWKCSKCGYEWQATIKDRSKHGCPHCAGKVVWEGHNDLASTHPFILAEWDYEKNKCLPSQVSRGSGKKVWWKCNTCHGNWQETVDNRVASNYGCPFCSGKRVLKGYNDLLFLYPKIAKEWDYKKNKGLTPESVTSKSAKKVWWKCSFCGTSYYKSISNRTNGSGCPKCSKESRSSLPEQIVFFYVKKAYPDAKNGYKPKWLNGKEIDIYIPKIRTAIEYDGRHWHTFTEKDAEKDSSVLKHGIVMLRIRELGTPKIDDNVTVLTTEKYRTDGLHLTNTLYKLFEKLKQIDSTVETPDIEINRDRNDIINQFITHKKNKSLVTKYPALAEEWDYEKNGALSPKQITAGSSIRVWWKCPKCGYSWSTSPKDRVRGSGCPACAGIIIVPGSNDLATLKPEIALEWDAEKNGDIRLSEISISDKRKFWWKCSKCGKNWLTSVAARKRPYCPDCNYHNSAKRRNLIIGETDFATLHPELLEEWDYEKNVWTNPSNKTAKSKEKVWWKCKKCGCEWQAAICDRSAGHGCPECAKQTRAEKRKRPIIGQSFGDLYPDLIKEWLEERNEGLSPFSFKPNSAKKVWWRCSLCGREWQAAIVTRANGHGCRSCAHKKKKKD